MHFASGAISHVTSKVSRVAPATESLATGRDAAMEMGVAAASAAKGLATEAASKACNVAVDSSHRAQDMLQRLKSMLEVWVKQKIHSQIVSLVDRIPAVAKNSLEDEQMPRAVSRAKDRFVDAAWPDFRSEILLEAAILLDRADESPDVERRGVDCFRAFFRYHLLPFDKSFWGKVRDPWWWLFSLIPLVPVYGVCPAWFFFVFLVLDKSDEFQLVSFILGFKGTAFISQGLIRALIGFTTFLGCVTSRASVSRHDCDSSGPGTNSNLWPMTIGFLLQLMLVWGAFFLLPCSKKKGQTALKGSINVEEEGHARVRGGYIIYFLWYDLLMFCICAGIVGWCISTRPRFDLDDWPTHHTVFAAQVLYGVLSAPFFVFTLPLLQRVLTHAVPTAYDRKGACRKNTGPPPPPRPVQAKREVVSDEDVADLYAKIKALLPMAPPV
mmetsp:Transcript_132912/g.384268  ORF Transcript_132912/g.384268 Transcript_132912/m.384268 type:complete len:440 (+) Transcript_132912:42-1361(+)